MPKMPKVKEFYHFKPSMHNFGHNSGSLLRGFEGYQRKAGQTINSISFVGAGLKPAPT